MPDGNWFERHLNWSLILGTQLAFWGAILMLLLIGEEELNTNTGPLSEMVPVLVWMISMAGIFYGTEIWYLRNKDQSLWFLLLNLLAGIGAIVLLGLPNKKVREE